MSPRAKRLAALGGAAVAGGAFLVLHRSAPMAPDARVSLPSSLTRANADYASRPKVAMDAYRRYVDTHVESADPKVRDQVGAARMRLGYLAAKRHDLPAARSAFLAAARVKGSEEAGEFGTIDDQAAYQAAVCLVAEGEPREAQAAFVSYLRERPLSPLVHAAYRRLQRLNGGESRPEWDRLLQSAVSAQEKRIRFETSVCGPKCLEHVLASAKGAAPDPDYRSIARLCGTTDDGTTIAGMRRALRAVGRPSWAAKLNQADIARAPLPAILLQGNHYVVLERVEGERARVWDPRLARTEPWKLPPADDPDFSTTAILLKKPEGL